MPKVRKTGSQRQQIDPWREPQRNVGGLLRVDDCSVGVELKTRRRGKQESRCGKIRLMKECIISIVLRLLSIAIHLVCRVWLKASFLVVITGIDVDSGTATKVNFANIIHHVCEYSNNKSPT